MARQPTSPTRHVRVLEDLAEKLGEIIEVEDTTSAEFLDPLIRTEIENRHKRNAVAIAAMRGARDAARKARDESPALATDLGGESN